MCANTGEIMMIIGFGVFTICMLGIPIFLSINFLREKVYQHRKKKYGLKDIYDEGKWEQW